MQQVQQALSSIEKKVVDEIGKVREAKEAKAGKSGGSHVPVDQARRA